MNEWLATWLWSYSRLLVIKSDEFPPFSLFEGRAQVKKTRVSILCFLINTTPSVSQTYITLSFFLSILISPATLCLFFLNHGIRLNLWDVSYIYLFKIQWLYFPYVKWMMIFLIYTALCLIFNHKIYWFHINNCFLILRSKMVFLKRRMQKHSGLTYQVCSFYFFQFYWDITNK